MFAEDLALPRAEVTDVLHSIAAVGARDKDRAEEFIAKFLPKGATAQQAGLKPPPVACGGYAELYAREVSHGWMCGREERLVEACPGSSVLQRKRPFDTTLMLTVTLASEPS